jgi:hypothetical protein
LTISTSRFGRDCGRSSKHRTTFSSGPNRVPNLRTADTFPELFIVFSLRVTILKIEMSLQPSQTFPNTAVIADAAGLLLRDLIDYAGLFPPASLSMTQSVANYDAYARSEWNWILGRFVVPVVRLSEFEDARAELPQPKLAPSKSAPSESNGESTRWRLSVLLGTDPVVDVACIRQFDARMASRNSCGRVVVESVEVKVASAEDVTRLSAAIPPEFTAYFEIPLSACGEIISAVSRCGQRAKIRTGGETADKFPASESVIEFIRLCAAAKVPFKATAGLHHPLRSVHRFTYQPDSPSGIMHGFVNVFLAAAFLRGGMEPELAIQVLDEQSAAAFQFDSAGIGWREHRLSRHEIAAARKDFAVSFGSCSFTEPIDDLRSLHIL